MPLVCHYRHLLPTGKPLSSQCLVWIYSGPSRAELPLPIIHQESSRQVISPSLITSFRRQIHSSTSHLCHLKLAIQSPTFLWISMYLPNRWRWRSTLACCSRRQAPPTRCSSPWWRSCSRRQTGHCTRTWSTQSMSVPPLWAFSISSRALSSLSLSWWVIIRLRWRRRINHRKPRSAPNSPRSSNKSTQVRPPPCSSEMWSLLPPRRTHKRPSHPLKRYHLHALKLPLSNIAVRSQQALSVLVALWIKVGIRRRIRLQKTRSITRRNLATPWLAR